MNGLKFAIVTKTYRGDCVRKIGLFIVMSSLLVACGIDDTRYKDFEIIDVNDPVDERAVIEQAMDEQRKLLKPGFITHHSNIENGFNLSYQSTYYNPQTEELLHKVNVTHAISDAFLAFDAEKNMDRYEEKVEALQDAKPLENHTGYVGFVEEDGEKRYDFAVKENDISYIFERGQSVDKGYDEEFVTSLGESLKTEEEGAYEYFYPRFEFQLENLHFPLINKEKVDHIEVEMSDLGYWAFSNPNTITVMYDLGEETTLRFYIEGMDNYSSNVGYTVVDEGKTEYDIPVTEYETDLEYRTIYTWEEDGYFYAIELDTETDPLTTEDIYAIIDSSRDDNRTFTNKEVFRAETEEPQLTDLDNDILEKLKEMGD